MNASALFDLDGTLVDSLDDLADAVNHMLEGFGRPLLTVAGVRQLVGKGARNLVQRALDTTATDIIEQGLALFTAYNTRHITDKSRLYPGARELLLQLSDNRIRMAVISNKPEALSRLILQELGIDTFFDVIAGGDTYPEMKPSPLPLLTVMGLLDSSPRNTYMIGDSINDIQAGIGAGVVTIGCNWGYGSTGELSGAEFRIDSLAEIPGIICRPATP